MSATEPNDFFKERRSFTEIKQEILGSYFNTWCNIRLATLKAEAREAMLYIDLHAGDGQDMAENPELPAISKEYLLKSIIKSPLLNNSVRTFFCDKSKAALEHVSHSMEALGFYDELLQPPVPLNNSDNKAQMAELLEAGCPSLAFTNPFISGYSQQMLIQAIHAWRTDLFMLLCPENMVKALAGKKVSQPLIELFGERLQNVSNYCRKEKDNYRRQEYILDNLMGVLQDKGYYTLLFKVNQPGVEQPYHYLLFSSPDSHAYRIFKETILPYSTYQEDNIPVFAANEFVQAQFSLFEQRPTYTIPNLVDRLVNQASLYKYKSIEKIYELDSCGTNYTRENYVAAFEQLRKEGKIELLNAKTMQSIRQPTPASVVKYSL
ncbi:hypothetical protein DXT99_23010 [Pontibacter diazotrophicus]|uniref:Three-Cys-motif partner protein TcmP n=1 Tax=Pontibacter diazotrophicus TaxID=1400979 RepID=A0A3D8L3Y1_9BACT|nr:three-Cys-motif partner protein TcmP [Pontibacter diazotrophicus]RDV12003.1 hypothetical protein DXT99_23010 [Pontibacter diazotrophicus]